MNFNLTLTEDDKQSIRNKANDIVMEYGEHENVELLEDEIYSAILSYLEEASNNITKTESN